MIHPQRIPRRASGFTLIELLVVVIIFAVIASVVSSQLLSVAADMRAEAPIAEAPLVAPARELTPAGQLVQWAGLALLLFGAGFWYLVELHSPGRLDRFRFGHFVLLALTYSLFFAIVAVLDDNGVGSIWAVGIAAAVSYPLLVLHVSTIVSLPFAARSALPLAVLTTGAVVNGVFGGETRSIVFLGIACMVTAHLTITYPRLQRGQEARRVELESALTRMVQDLTPDAAVARGAIADADALLALHDPTELSTLRDWVARRLDTLRAQLDVHERVRGHHDAMRAATARRERRAHREAGVQTAERLLSQLPQAIAAVEESVLALTARRSDRAAPSDPPTPDHVEREHCVACGHACAGDARFCPGCGTRCATVLGCRRCREVLRLPVHLMAASADDHAPVTHCIGCGERHAG